MIQWNMSYSGGDDLMDFFERCEELAECYDQQTDRLLLTLPLVLRDNALKWYRVKRAGITSWSSFKKEAGKFFLPTNYLTRLENVFYSRRQQNRESAKDYVLSMLTLVRHHPTLKSAEHLDRIYDGLRIEYRHYIRRSDVKSLDDLMALADDFELLKRDEARNERPHTSHIVSRTSAAKRKVTICWRCKETGHLRYQCRNTARLFCSRCLRDGILSRECNCSFSPKPEPLHTIYTTLKEKTKRNGDAPSVVNTGHQNSSYTNLSANRRIPTDRNRQKDLLSTTETPTSNSKPSNTSVFPTALQYRKSPEFSNDTEIHRFPEEKLSEAGGGCNVAKHVHYFNLFI